MSKVIYEGMGITLIEVVPGPVTQLTHFPNIQWKENGVEKLGHLTTTHSKKFPKGFQPGEWRRRVLLDITTVIDRSAESAMTEEEVTKFCEAVWTAYAHETHGVNTCNSVLPVAAYWQLHFCLPGGIIARARRRNMKDGQYRTNYNGFTYTTSWGEYELVFSTIVPGALDGRWLIDPKLIKEMLILIVDHQYPFLAGIFDNLRVNRWPGRKPVVWADISLTPELFDLPPYHASQLGLQTNGEFATQDVERVLAAPCQMTELAEMLGTKPVEIPDELLHLPVKSVSQELLVEGAHKLGLPAVIDDMINKGVHPSLVASELAKRFMYYRDVIVDDCEDLNRNGKVGILK